MFTWGAPSPASIACESSWKDMLATDCGGGGPGACAKLDCGLRKVYARL